MARKVMQRNYDNEGNLISKECSCCHKVKPVSEFNKCKSKSDRLQIKCKECLKKYYQENSDCIKEKSKEYYEKNKESKKEYQKENKEHIKERKKIYYQKNSDYFKEKNKEHYKNNAEYYKEYQKDNAERIKEKNKEYHKNHKEYHKEYYKEYNTKKAQESLQQIKIEVENNPDKYNHIKGKDIYGIVYLVHNIESNKYYVGQTTIGFNNRYPKGWLYEHGKKDTVKHDLELYGENSFEYVKIFKVAYSQHELDKLEAYYIDYYNSYENGYNETRGNIFTDRGKEK